MTFPVGGMTDAGASPALPPRLAELTQLDQGARLAQVETLSAKGFEPGCWLRIDDADLTTDAGDVRALLEGLDAMERLSIGAVEEFEGEHPWDPPTDGEPAWIIISQTCDLVRDVRDEPLVQLALLRLADDGVDLASQWRNSNRWVPLDPTGEGSRYLVDLRVQAFAPKHLIAPLDVRQAIPANSDFVKRRPRTRFCKRVGERYSRMGIPTAIVTAVCVPIQAAAGKKKGLRQKLDAAFSEWLLMPPENEGDPLVLFAVTPHASDTDEFFQAEDLFVEEFLAGLPQEVLSRLDEERCAVIALDDLRVPQWIAAWRLDLDFLTYGSKGEQDSPEPL